uniref:Ubiquitin-like protease family profile domain-containing protein n=1 Tax=Oryza meridionalis TaxID=40149 RepID=A0A0E0D3Y3_9ORYZ
MLNLSCARSHVDPAGCSGNSTNRYRFQENRLVSIMKLADRQQSPVTTSAATHPTGSPITMSAATDPTGSPITTSAATHPTRSPMTTSAANHPTGDSSAARSRASKTSKDDSTCTVSDDPVITGVIDAFRSPPILQKTAVSGLQTQILLSLGDLSSQICETQKMLIKMAHDNTEFQENMNDRMTNVEHIQQLQLQQVTNNIFQFPRKRYIEVEYPSTIGKRVRGVNGRAVVSNKKFDCYKRCLVDGKDDFNFVCTTEETRIALRILCAKPTETIIHIDDVVLTKADLAFVKHFGQSRSIKRHKHMYHAYLETPSVVSMLIKYGYYDGVKLGNTDENMYKSAGVSYVNNDMIFLPIRTSIDHWYVAVQDCTRKEVCVLDSMDTTEDDLKELKFLMKGIRKCVRLVLDDKIVENPRWDDYNVQAWKIRIRYNLPNKKDRTSSGLYSIKFMELWTGDSLSKQFYQEDIDSYRRKLAAILYMSPSNKLRNNICSTSNRNGTDGGTRAADLNEDILNMSEIHGD